VAGAAGGGGERRGGGEVSPAAVATGSQGRFLLVHLRREQNWKSQVRTLKCRENLVTACIDRSFLICKRGLIILSAHFC